MTFSVTLPSGEHKSYHEPVTAIRVAKDISRSLAKKTVAIRLNGALVDLDCLIEDNCTLELVTEDSDEGLDVIRHSTAHLLAHAVKRLYGDQVKIAMGPTIEDGFYYDFDCQQSFTPEDLIKIEKMMQKLSKESIVTERLVLSKADARALFDDLGEPYKVEIVDSLQDDEVITAYRQGDFIDLCRGPHVQSTAKLKAFKLTKLAGSYWKGDAANQPLQRIYGTAWPSQDQLDNYLKQLQEAQRRDHRLLAQSMDLYHIQPDAPGMVFWHAKGWRVFQQIIAYIRNRLDEQDYEEVSTPTMLDQKLWIESGHWEKFCDNMFTSEVSSKSFCVKPMNCPGNIQVFNQGLKSYRDLPIRMGEFGVVYRNEASGTLHGLMRLVEFTQDDAHVFCTNAQLPSELEALIELVFSTYRDFGFEQIGVKMATRPEKRIGDDATWDQSENCLRQSLNDCGVSFEELPGEGAFYGPKIEFHLTDCLKRVWQCGTIQLDFSMPQRLSASYVDESGQKVPPIMIHRAIFGSIERFMGILLEHYAGVLPLWLSPQPIVVCTITDRAKPYAKSCINVFKQVKLCCQLDDRNEKLGYKVRQHTLAKIPFIVILGDQEVEGETLSIRQLDGTVTSGWQLSEFIDQVLDHMTRKACVVELSNPNASQSTE
ncbi:MAG: threonine--tRNA ligase [Legionellales bacterium]|nr:threonine--tRNA ligase [Legionellales bacterium]